jgi:hypothetical protein
MIRRARWAKATQPWLRFLLLLIVIGSAGALAAREWWGVRGAHHSPQDKSSQRVQETNATAQPNRVEVYYFYGNVRCPTCRRMEEYSRKAVEEGFSREIKDGKVLFAALNIDEPLNEHFIRDYQLHTKSLIVASYADGRETGYTNLTLIWNYVRAEEQFMSYVHNEVRAALDEVAR